MALKTNNTLWAWGSNSYGQLGIGNSLNRSSPVQLGSATNWSQISSSQASLAITKG
jgi:alpha-tubulin suppressor-like RCC1 family protein